MKPFNLSTLCAYCAVFALTLTACEKPNLAQQPAPTTNAPTNHTPEPAAANTSNTSTILVGSGIASGQTITLSTPIKSVLADVSATFIYDPAVGDKITVTADNNIQEHLKINIDNGTLKLAPFASSIQQKTPIQITWGGAAPDTIDIKGSSKVILRKFNGTQLRAQISGSGEIDVDGATQNLSIDIAGSGAFIGSQFSVQTCALTVSGSGSIVAQVKDDISGNITGSASAVISGNPKTRAVTVTGSGRVVYQ